MKILTTTVSLLLAAAFFPGFAADEQAIDIAAEAKRIDKLVAKQLKAQKLKRHAKVDDNTFLRRAYLDLIGRTPTIEEAESFLGSSYDRKRDQLIADLLQSDGHVSHAYHFWADILRINSGLGNGARHAESAYQLFVKDAIAKNMPYDEMVRELVTATGHIWDNGATGYYLRDRGMPLDNMSNTVRVFLGTRLECAQCHDHPFDKWTQMDYFQMAAFSYGMEAGRYQSENRKAFTAHYRTKRMEVHEQMLKEEGYEGMRLPSFSSEQQMKRTMANPRFEKSLQRYKMEEDEFIRLAKLSIEKQKEVQDSLQPANFAMSRIYQQLQYFSAEEKDKTLKLPHDYQYSDAEPLDPVEPLTMFGELIDLDDIDESAIQTYADWMTAKDNPTFTKVIANRMWKHVFGHGIFEPIDEITDHTPISNPELLAHLEDLMRELDYDLRTYQQILYSTRTYQSAAHTEEVELGAHYYFQGPLLRRMKAEQIWDSIVGMALPEVDSYRPSLEKQLGMIANYEQMYAALEDRSAEEYIAMIDELAAAVAEYQPHAEALRQDMFEAREAKDDARYGELRRELGKLQSEERKLIRDVAFNYTGEKVDTATLLASVGLTQMSGDSMMAMGGMDTQLDADGMPVLEKGVMTRLPKLNISKKPPEHLSKNEKREWARQQGIDLRYYQQLVSKMARASELPSPAPRGHFLREFGQSDREVIENSAAHASVPQALNLLNGTIVEALTNKFSVFGNRLHGAGDAQEKARMIFLAMLSREPTQQERELVAAEVEANGDAAYEGIVWALLNTQQFIFVQ